MDQNIIIPCCPLRPGYRKIPAEVSTSFISDDCCTHNSTTLRGTNADGVSSHQLLEAPHLFTMIPTTIYCIRAPSSLLSNEATSYYNMGYSAYDYRRADNNSLSEEVSSGDLETLKNIVKDIRQNPNMLLQVFPTISTTILR